MNEELQRIFDSAPLEAGKSRLEPYRELVLRWRRQGRSYRRICQLLRDLCGVEITYLPLYEFVQRRSRPRKPAPEPEIERVDVPATQQTASQQGKKLTADERAAQVEFIRSLNQPPSENQPKPGWNFDVDKPRTIQKL